MPIYEYRCGACGFQKEFLQRLNDKPLTVCPECGKRAFSKMVTAAGFQLKGTGWYATDFRGGKTATGSDSSDAKADKPAAADKSAVKDSAKSTAAAETPAARATDASTN